MRLAAAFAQALSIVAFAGYGTSALVTDRMAAEFQRFGLAHLRVLTGTLQIVGSVALFVGYFFRPLLLLSAGGFAAMMVIGLVVRVRIRDPFVEMIPAFTLMCLNLFVVFSASSRG